jgi:hypothetical protein
MYFVLVFIAMYVVVVAAFVMFVISQWRQRKHKV